MYRDESSCAVPLGEVGIPEQRLIGWAKRLMSIVTLSDKGQVVIPAAIRHRLGIVRGAKLEFELESGSIFCPIASSKRRIKKGK